MKPEEWLDEQIDLLARERRPGAPADDEAAELLAVVIAGKRLGAQAAPSLDSLRKAGQISPPKRSIRSHLARYLAVAMVVAVLLVGANLAPQLRSWQVAYAMEQAVAKLTSYHAVIEYRWMQAGETAVDRTEFWVQGDRYYWEKIDHRMGTERVISDGTREWTVKPDRKSAFHGYPVAYDLREWSPASLAKKVLDQPFSIEGEESVGGRTALRVIVTPKGGEPYRVWIDKETKLPLQYRSNEADPSAGHTMTYTVFELNPTVDPAQFTYQPPAEYQVTESPPVIPTLAEAARVAGFNPPVPKERPRRIFAGKSGISLDFGYATIDYARMDPDFNQHPLTTAGWSKAGPVFWLGDSTLLWYQDGLQVFLYGDLEGGGAMELARQILPDMSLPLDRGGSASFNRQAKQDVWPDMPRAYAMELERAKDPTLYPERADAQAVTLQFLGEQGIQVDAAELTEAGNITIEMLYDMQSGPIKRVYLRQVARNDGHGLWWVIGYDPR